MDGDYTVALKGDITIHGITRPLSVPAVITVKNKTISAKTEFTVSPADFNIIIPAIVKDNISKQIKVRVSVPDYQPIPGN